MISTLLRTTKPTCLPLTHKLEKPKVKKIKADLTLRKMIKWTVLVKLGFHKRFHVSWDTAFNDSLVCLFKGTHVVVDLYIILQLQYGTQNCRKFSC